MPRNFLEDALEDRRCWAPLGRGETIASELEQLRRARDRGGEMVHQPGQFIGCDDAAEVEQSMEAKRHADRIGGLECECIGEGFWCEPDVVVALE